MSNPAETTTLSAPAPSDPDAALDFCCKRKKNCPKLHDEGAEGIVISDPDQSPNPIRLTVAQAEEAEAWLCRRRAARKGGT